jgi:pyruvate dehydrogenase E1 component alpha subunit
MQPDLWKLYRQMLFSRRFEEAVADLWHQGLISGEMHLGTGEEAIVAGVLDHLIEGDALALDHRGTPPLVMRDVDPVALLREFLGRTDGLCSGLGGHMHLFSPEHLAASSGIVGASGPAAAGFALAAQYLRPGTLAVAFFGESAMNQGMLMESLNLAAVWQLPVLLVCKDNDWAITTRSHQMIAGKLTERAQSFGIPAVELDGSDVGLVWQAAKPAVDRARAGGGPSFLHAHCSHLHGHFMGDALLRMPRRPFRELLPDTGRMLRSALQRRGAPPKERAQNLSRIAKLIRDSIIDHGRQLKDPLKITRQQLASDKPRLLKLEREVAAEIGEIVEWATAPVEVAT